MGSLFGGIDKSHDIRDIVTMLQEGTSAICNESVANEKIGAVEVDNMADSIKTAMYEHYSQFLPESMEGMLREDAESASQMFINNMAEMKDTLTESASMPSLVTLTASIATTMRTPYEATMHRVFDTRTLDKQTVEIEEIIPVVKAPDQEEEDMIDALSPYAATKFVDKTELAVTSLTAGLVPGDACKKLDLMAGKNPLFRINRDARVTRITATVTLKDGTTTEPVDAAKIKLKKGSVPYFDAKTSTLACVFEATDSEGTVHDLDVSAKIDFSRNQMEYLRADAAVTKVYFDATVSHAEHTHPIYTTFRNNFEQFTVPTRPHIEVSLPQETRTDISNSIQHFANTDIITAMTENISVISSRMEDQRLKKCLDAAHMFEAEFSFEAPANFAYGNLEWFKREFVPFLDQVAVAMKSKYNITDCHFRIAVSPYLLKIIDTDYSMDKSLTEESKGAGVINYSIGCKTSTSTFYFVSSQNMTDNVMQVCLIPNNFKNSQVKTYTYFKYSSFLTDQLRRADNNAMPAIVYSERNLPIVFTPVSAQVTITELPITKTTGARFIKAV